MLSCTLHLIAPFHTSPTLAASHCAFTGKALRFPKMMKGFFPIVEYANEGSDSEADEKVVMLSSAECDRFYPRESKDFWSNHARIGSEGWKRFDARLRVALLDRVKHGDFIAHPFGRAHEGIAAAFPEATHVETGIGYTDAPIGAFRIFESEAWRHWHWGKHGEDGPGRNKSYTYVIPNYFDLDEWPIGGGGGGYVLFLGRIDACKGVYILADIVKEWFKVHPDSDLRFLFAGQGDFTPVADACKSDNPASTKNIEFLGPVSGMRRAELFGDAAASIMPTQFVEPFGGSGVEGMLCGTPLLASDWGAFTETVIQGVTGYRCRTMGDWLTALERITLLNRAEVARIARSRYSLEACRRMYEQAFTAMHELYGVGWYSRRDTLMPSQRTYG